MDNVTAWSYTLRNDEGEWLGQVVLTSDGFYGSVTDYGNLSYAWRHFGAEGFREFICSLNPQYLGDKLYSGMAYIARSRSTDKACHRYAELILPALQKAIREDIAKETVERLRTDINQ